MSDEIRTVKSCPHCGAPGIFQEWITPWDENEQSTWKVVCADRCQWADEDKAEAAARWNRREGKENE
jgi:hypothetical protein